MHQAKTPQCKLFWLLIIVVSLSMTTISVYEAVNSFIDEPSYVALSRQKENEILYPPLKVCFRHWVTWVNWTAVEEMHFTKQEVLFALSFLTDIFSEEYFDEKQIEESFYSKLRANGISQIDDFFTSIAYKRIKIIEDVSDDQQEFHISLEDFAHCGLPYWLCYRLSEGQMRSIIEEVNPKTSIYRSSMDRFVLKLNFHHLFITQSNLPKWLTEYEFSTQVFYRSLFSWGRKKRRKDRPFFGAHVYPNGYSKNNMMLKGYFSLHFTIDISAYSLMNKNEAQCHESRQWITSNETCSETCSRKFETDKIEDRLKVKNFGRIIYTSRIFKIYFGKLNESEITSVVDNAANVFSFETPVNIKKKESHENVSAKREYDECLKNCSLEIGCEKWSYSFDSPKISSAEIGMATIAYPTNVALMKEVDLQTWANFIGNIGGLLGVWSGASILSIFQIVYLCCSNRVTRQKRITAQKHDGDVRETTFSSQILSHDDKLFVPVPHDSADIVHVPSYA